MVADFHARAISAMKGGHLECVYSRKLENVDRLAKAYGAAAYTNYTQFLAHPSLDIVTIATPSGAHLEPVQKAAAAGKHVICEKPLEISLERIDKWFSKRTAGLRQHSFDFHYQQLRRCEVLQQLRKRCRLPLSRCANF